MLPKVSVIISNKNNANLLKSSLANLLEIQSKYYEHLEVIVVDNNSSDGTVDMIKTKFPWVIIISTENKGLAYANNLGAQKATGEYYLFLGADGYPRVDTIGKLVEYLEGHKDVGIATPKLSLHGGKPDTDAHRRFPTPWNSFTRLTGLYKLFPRSRIFNEYFMGHENPNIPHEIDASVSAFMLISAKTFKEIGGFDTDYFAYGEDLDICYRLKKQGYKVMYLPQWESGHFKVRLNPDKASLAEKVKMAKSSTNAMRIFLRKHYTDIYPPSLVGFINAGIHVVEVQRVAGVYLKHLLGIK